MKKFIFVILMIFAFCFKSNAHKDNKFYDKNWYNLSVGYSYSYPNTHEVFINLLKFEYSFYFNNNKTYLENTIAPYGTCYWYNRENSGFWGVKIGYLINRYFSAGLSFSWKNYTMNYTNGYCSLHNENHEWVKGQNWEMTNKGIGVYAKVSYPISVFSLFACGQVSTNKNFLIGVGIMFNFSDLIFK